jgi:tight adherence protein B
VTCWQPGRALATFANACTCSAATRCCPSGRGAGQPSCTWAGSTVPNWDGEIRRNLEQADLGHVSPAQYLLVLVGGGLALLVGLMLLFGMSAPFAAVLAFGVTYLAPRYFLDSRRDHYLAAFNQQMAEIALTMSNAMRAGLSIRQAVDIVARELPPPGGREFARLGRELSLGSSFEEAGQRLAARLPSDELKVMMTAILVQAQVGGNLSRALAEISQTLAQRKSLQNEVRTLTAETRYVAQIVPVIPLGIILMLRAGMPEMVDALFNTVPGFITIVIYIGVQILAYNLVRRISDIKV